MDLADLFVRALEEHREQLNAEGAAFTGRLRFIVDLDANVAMRRVQIHPARILSGEASTHEAGNQDLQGGHSERSAALLLSAPPPLKYPPPDPPHDGANFFERVRYLVNAARFLVQEDLNTRHELEHLMATQAELQAALDANTAATAAAAAAISAEIGQLRQALSQLSAEWAPTQATLDQINASTSSLEAATAALVADDPAAAPPTT